MLGQFEDPLDLGFKGAFWFVHPVSSVCSLHALAGNGLSLILGLAALLWLLASLALLTGHLVVGSAGSV